MCPTQAEIIEKSRQLIKLHNSGMSDILIADRLNISRNDVEDILRHVKMLEGL